MAPLILIFIVVPIAEIYVIVKVGGLIGILPTLALLVADSVLGSWLMRSQGRAVWRRGGRMFGFSVATGRRGDPVARHDYDVDGTAHETEQPRLER
jgi:UPF0716 family protein affecting phage T7 exclusion